MRLGIVAAVAIPLMAQASPPRLVLLIVVDQMRADELFPGGETWPGGFGRLTRNGRVFERAYHGHGHTETATGHAVIATGLHPRLNGIPGKHLRERGSGSSRKPCNLEEGPCDPSWLAVPTLGDRLKVQSPKSRVVAIAFKPRAALLLGGTRADLTVWIRLDPLRIEVSSRLWLSPPQWLKTVFREATMPDKRFATWTLPWLPAGWAHRPDHGLDEADPGYGTTFPHPIPEGRDDLWALSPDADRVVLDLALAAAENLQLGSDEAPDLLMVSLAATDAVGHLFGPDSLERAATLALLDQRLDRFLETLWWRTRGEMMVMLTSDHAVTSTVWRLRAEGQSGGRVKATDLASVVSKGLLTQSGLNGCVERVDGPYLWLAPACRDSRTVAAAASILASHPAVYAAWPVSELSTSTDRVAALLWENTFPGRTGEVAFALKPGWHLEDPSTGGLGAEHGSPWEPDRWVPLVLWGHGIVPGRIADDVLIVDAIRTLSDRLGLDPIPGGGQPLP